MRVWSEGGRAWRMALGALQMKMSFVVRAAAGFGCDRFAEAGWFGVSDTANQTLREQAGNAGAEGAIG
jgi:hypothetical protein